MYSSVDPPRKRREAVKVVKARLMLGPLLGNRLVKNEINYHKEWKMVNQNFFRTRRLLVLLQELRVKSRFMLAVRLYFTM